MKKNAKNFIVLAILTLFFSGCMKYDVNMTVGEDKSVKLEVISAVNVSMMEDMMGGGESSEDDEYTDDEYFDDEYTDDEYSDDEYFDDETGLSEEDGIEDSEEENSQFDAKSYKFLEEKGYKVEEYTEETENGTLTGVKVSKTFDNIDDITKETEKKIDFVTFFEEEGFDDSQIFTKSGSNYKGMFTFDFSQDAEEGMDFSQYDSYFDIQYKITLPSKVISSNATNVSEDGKTLTWDLSYGKLNEVNFEFSFGKDNTMLFIIIGAVAGVAVIGVVVFLLMKNKKNKTPNTPATNTVEPVAPATQETPVTPTTPTTEQQPVTEQAPVVIPTPETPVAETTPTVEPTAPVEATAVEPTPVVEVTPEVVTPAVEATPEPTAPVIAPTETLTAEEPVEPVVIISEPTEEKKVESLDDTQNPTMPQ